MFGFAATAAGTGEAEAADTVRSRSGGMVDRADLVLVQTPQAFRPSARISAATFSEVRRAKANVDAAEADVAAAELSLRSAVVAQFLTALQSEASLALQDSLLKKVQLDLELAKARTATRPVVIVIDSDPWHVTKAGGSWWEVGVPEVSDRAEVRSARKAFEVAQKGQILV